MKVVAFQNTLPATNPVVTGIGARKLVTGPVRCPFVGKIDGGSSSGIDASEEKNNENKDKINSRDQQIRWLFITCSFTGQERGSLEPKGLEIDILL